MSKTGETIVETEWSYFFDALGMAGSRAEVSISPNEEERRRLALRLNLLSLDALKADIVIQFRSGEATYHVKGKFKAALTQACVVTLEPVKSKLDETFESWFSDPQGPVSFTKLKHEREAAKAYGEMPLLEEKDDPEALVAGKIDLGELVNKLAAFFFLGSFGGRALVFARVRGRHGSKLRAQVGQNTLLVFMELLDLLARSFISVADLCRGRRGQRRCGAALVDLAAACQGGLRNGFGLQGRFS
jgi:hypothetical protein